MRPPCLLFWHSIWHLFWHPIWHPSWHLFWHYLWIVFGYSIWHLLWFGHSFWHSIWHPILALYLASTLTFSLTWALPWDLELGRPALPTEIWLRSGAGGWGRLRSEIWSPERRGEESRGEERRRRVSLIKSRGHHKAGGEWRVYHCYVWWAEGTPKRDGLGTLKSSAQLVPPQLEISANYIFSACGLLVKMMCRSGPDVLSKICSQKHSPWQLSADIRPRRIFCRLILHLRNSPTRGLCRRERTRHRNKAVHLTLTEQLMAQNLWFRCFWTIGTHYV